MTARKEGISPSNGGEREMAAVFPRGKKGAREKRKKEVRKRPGQEEESRGK